MHIFANDLVTKSVNCKLLKVFVFDSELHHLKESFGPSNELIISLQRSNQRKTIDNGNLSSTLQQEAQFLASYNYEKNTLWGKQASNNLWENIGMPLILLSRY